VGAAACDAAVMLCCAPPAMTAARLPGTTLTVTERDDDAPDVGSSTDSVIVYTVFFCSVYGLSENV